MGCQVYGSSGIEICYTDASWCAVRLCAQYGEESKKARRWHDNPWYDHGVTERDVHITNDAAPLEIPESYKVEFTEDAYKEARQFIKDCAEAGCGFMVSY